MVLFNNFFASGTQGATFNLHQCTILARAFSVNILLGSKPMVTENEFEAMCACTMPFESRDPGRRLTFNASLCR